MELAALILIAVLVWYYWHSLKVATEIDSYLESGLLTEFLGIKDALTRAARNIADLDRQVAKIESYAQSTDVEWKYFNKQKIDPMLQELAQIGGELSVSLGSIHDKLGMIESAADAIAAHSPFHVVERRRLGATNEIAFVPV